jgi:hypothetical protein
MTESRGPGQELNWLAEEGVRPAVERPILEPSDRRSSIEGHRETTRSVLAQWLMLLLTIVVVGLLILAGLQMAGVFNQSVLSITDLATAVLTPIVTLAGTALGFYFGAQTAGDDITGTPRRRSPEHRRRAG